jgi:hypothetical protein
MIKLDVFELAALVFIYYSMNIMYQLTKNYLRE